ncbi:MAG: hypothetical protein PWQ73_154 [Petrotoga sp.]|jgi:predicted SAM-dependent methyltransferase|nr:hypothetical protein [Petrotoga sp.]
MEFKEFYDRYWELIKFRNEFNLPKIVLNAWDDFSYIQESDTFKILKSHIIKYKNPKILDIGAGDKKLKEIINLMKENFIYKSLDISKNVYHDFNDINSVTENFDIIFMLELIEHLPLELSLKYFSKSFEILNENGVLIISTPNIDHINQLWKQDITHIHQYPAKDIYSILRMIGFSNNIQTFRINLTQPKLNLKKIVLERLRIIINKILGTDYAHGILIIAKK